MRPIGFFFFIVFFVFGCGVIRKSTTSHSDKNTSTSSQSSQISNKVESFISKETTSIDTTKIKAESINASISVAALKDSNHILQTIVDQLNYELLKAKAQTGTKAGVEIIYDTIHKKIFIKGTCDSSEILSLRKSNYELRASIKELQVKDSDSIVQKSETSYSEQEEKTKGYTFWNMFLCGIVSIIIGMIIGIIIKILYL